MNEPVLKDGFKSGRPNAGKQEKAVSKATGRSRDYEPIDEQEFEHDNRLPRKGNKYQKYEGLTQDRNVKAINTSDAKDSDLDHALPADYRASITQAIEPGNRAEKSDDEKGLE